MCGVLLSAATLRADEGMWLLPLIQKMNSEALKERGCRLTPEQIYSINNTSLKDAVVHFGGGCTGEIISDQGLLVTNHHCGYSYIQALSTPEHNYLENGWWAMQNSEEMHAEGLSVTFLQSMTDVTDYLQKVYDKALKQNRKAADAEQQAQAAVNEAKDELARQAMEENPHSRAGVVSFYNDNVYYLIVNKTYTDVRFVGAPPRSSGKFGGDTDNWMWPRHTCDFSMWRVYAGPDNEPADYSPENRPLQPKNSLKVSLRGVEDGDFAMIMGYPGRTQRFQTAAQLQQMLDINDIRIAARTVRQDIMWDARMADETVNLQYASKYASSSNGWKKWIGMKEAFANLNIIGREQEREAEFTEWVNAKKKRQEAYGGAIGRIAGAVEQGTEPYKAYTLLSETIGRIEIASFAAQFSFGFRSALRHGMDSTQALAAKTEFASVYKDYNEALDRREAKALIEFYLANVNPEDKISIEGHPLEDVDAFVEWMFAGTNFSSAEKMNAISDFSQVTSDPAYMLYAAMSDVARTKMAALQASNAEVASASKAFTAGQLEWKKGEPSYPDANSTMRLTYGNVKSYSPKDGVIYKHYTTLKGVMEKEDPTNYEFIVPARLKEIYETKDYGDYANAAGELPTCFLINCDITGGNSGSPVMDADGCLIGLAFDGNWEAMSSDVMFEPNLQRCICVDIRYVLLLMDKFGGAGYLLSEMNIVK
jgi:hypothetical protein